MKRKQNKQTNQSPKHLRTIENNNPGSTNASLENEKDSAFYYLTVNTLDTSRIRHLWW